MPEAVKERRELDPRFQWDLTTIFADDAAWETAFKAVDAELGALPALAGTLHTAAAVRRFLDISTAQERTLSKLYVYASLRYSEDIRDTAAKSMVDRMGAKVARYGASVAFAEPEMLSLPEDELAAIVESPELEPYRFMMRDLLRQKPHILSAGEEKLLASLGDALGAASDIADNLMDADLVFDDVTDGAGEKHPLSGSSYIPYQMSPDRALRESAFHNFYKSYAQHNNTFAAAYSGTVKAAAAEAEARHFPSSRAMSMAGENIPAEVYDNLVAAVRAHLPAMYRYVALRKRLLGVDELHYYDVYAPLVKDNSTRYTYEQAQQMVLEAVAPLGKDYQALVQKAYDERWIDVYPNKGKTGGAFSSGVYDTSPYILMNFAGSLDSVSTLAHEMGHSLHSWHSNHAQPPQSAHYTLFVAEVASTVNENLMIEQLLAKDPDPATRLYLLNQYLENFKGTVYRQTMFAEFEREAHAMCERGEALSPAALNALYAGLVKDYFGPELVMDDEVQYEWSRIPHFYRPFYVYKYATGYSTAVALSEGILHGGPEAVKKYKEFLSMGGSAYPLDELRHAGVDLAAPEPVNRALEKFARIVADAEATAAKLGL